MNARLLHFELPPEWEQKLSQSRSKKRQKTPQKSPKHSLLTGLAISSARKRLQLSQRVLADRIGKSQSWIRDIEKERFQPNTKDLALLRRVLEIAQ